MIPIELELKTCPTCNGASMIDGERCPDCRGRGVVRRRAGDVPDVPAGAEGPTDAEVPAVVLSKLKLAELQAIAEELGLDTTGTRAALIERIETARASTEADQGGDDQPADDPDASASEEAGPPPDPEAT